MTALATPEQLQTWLGLSDIDESRADAFLDAASALVRSSTQQQWDSAVPDDVSSVTVQIAAHMWTNPTGASSSTTGPFAVTYDPHVVSGLLDQLDHYRTASGVWTLGTTRGPLETHRLFGDTVFVNTDPPGDPVPYDFEDWTTG